MRIINLRIAVARYDEIFNYSLPTRRTMNRIKTDRQH